MKLIDLNSSTGTNSEEKSELMVFTAILFPFDSHFVRAVLQLRSWPLLSVFNKAFEMHEFAVYSVVDIARKFIFILKEVKYQHLILCNYMKGKGELICSDCLFISLSYLSILLPFYLLKMSPEIME